MREGEAVVAGPVATLEPYDVTLVGAGCQTKREWAGVGRLRLRRSRGLQSPRLDVHGHGASVSGNRSMLTVSWLSAWSPYAR